MSRLHLERVDLWEASGRALGRAGWRKGFEEVMSGAKDD